ncbi:putative structural protein [Pseudomonas phage ventosus]|uniref:Putative structural protein n=1 Tax=Pseudomonas phage ventosus TaxID=2048980 RepID=A0A2H4P8C6_9CAUD|nr:putative structural protein [Pseudomonas phage ventosus]
MDLLLNSDTNDLVFVNGKCPVTQLLVDIVAQRLKVTLYTFLGEWFLDTTIGVPYFQQIFGKIRTKATIDLIFQRIISNDPDVIEILSFESSLASNNRGYTMTFQVRVSDNTASLPITIEVGA